MNRVSLEHLDELEVELFDSGVLRNEEATNVRAISNFFATQSGETLRVSPSSATTQSEQK